jgi:hypothetical protein
MDTLNRDEWLHMFEVTRLRGLDLITLSHSVPKVFEILEANEQGFFKIKLKQLNLSDSIGPRHPRNHYIRFYANPLLQVILYHKDKDWNYELVANNKLMQWRDFASTQKVINWRDRIVNNPNITQEHVLRNVNCLWFKPELLCRVLPYDMLGRIPRIRDYIKASDHYLGNNETITIKTLKEFYFNKNQWFKISTNPNFSDEDVMANKKLHWNAQGLSYNPNITLKCFRSIEMRPHPQILEHCSLEEIDELGMWQPNYISQNRNLTIKFLFEHRHRPWTWVAVFRNPSLPLQDLLEFFESQPELTVYIEEYADMIVKRQDFTLDMLESLPWIKDHSISLELNPHITMDFVLKHPEFEWDFQLLSSNPNITWEDVMTHFDLGWSFGLLCSKDTIR